MVYVLLLAIFASRLPMCGPCRKRRLRVPVRWLLAAARQRARQARRALLLATPLILYVGAWRVLLLAHAIIGAARGRSNSPLIGGVIVAPSR